MKLEGIKDILAEHTPGLMDATGKFAVLVPLVEQNGKLHLLYEVRGANMRRQPGEVCFPGGKMEGGESPLDCALRETWEELGISSEHITVLGQLDFIAHRANFIMYPIVALVDEQGFSNMKLSEHEVAETLLIPLDYLQNTPPLEYSYALRPMPAEGFPYELLGISRDYKWQDGGENVPVYTWENHAIWGLTGRITRHLLQLLTQQGGDHHGG